VVQLYNLHAGYFSYSALPYLSRRRTVVWHLSDMWAMTGHCAYSYACDRWLRGCGRCPHLSDRPYPLKRDTTATLWKAKRALYARSRLTVVAPSRWLGRLAGESPLLGRFPVHVIPYGLDTEVFRPIDKAVAREALGIDPTRPVVLFGAHAIWEPRKGSEYLAEALARLAAAGRRDVFLLTIGSTSSGWPARCALEGRHLGFIQSDLLMAIVYSAADVFVLPTLADNLPNGVLESMACGTPCVAFDVGGVGDAVRHMETGYLASYRDAGDLARGIDAILGDAVLRADLGRRARSAVEKEFTLRLQAERYLELYRQLAATANGA
jgi:glycosyltransferase involved in cell wall biosynthesis